MGVYERAVLPRFLNAACGTKAVEPLRRRVCRALTGDVDLVTAAGFTITELDVFYEPGTLKATGADSLGVAVTPPTLTSCDQASNPG